MINNLIRNLLNRRQQNKRPNISYNRGFLCVDADLSFTRSKYKDADEEHEAYEDSFTRWHEWRKENKQNTMAVSSIHNTLWRSRVRSFEIIDSLSDRQILQMNGIGSGGLQIARAVSAWDKEMPNNNRATSEQIIEALEEEKENLE